MVENDDDIEGPGYDLDDEDTDGPIWTDPDTPPPSWLYDPNAPPSARPAPPPGMVWKFQNGKWDLIAAMPAQTGPTGGPTGTGPTIPPPPTSGPPQVPYVVGGGGGFTWPAFDDPGLFDPGPAFTFRDFIPPDPSKITEDPSYKFRFNQGLGALKAQRAGQGTFLTGATGKAMQEFGQNFASGEMDNIYQRALSEYGTNRNNASDIWSKQYGQRQDVYGSKVGRSNSLNNWRQRQAEMDFNDIFNRWKASGDWLTKFGSGDD